MQHRSLPSTPPARLSRALLSSLYLGEKAEGAVAYPQVRIMSEIDEHLLLQGGVETEGAGEIV